jgi:hypothetical protein
VEVEYVDEKNLPINSADSVTDLINVILSMSNPDHESDAALQVGVATLARMILPTNAGILRSRYMHEFGMKKLLPKPISLSNVSYQKIFPPVGFYITDKADGLRAVAMKGCFPGETTLTVLTTDRYLSFDAKQTSSNEIKATIVDCELIGGTAMYVFDVMYVGGKAVHEIPFEQRLPYIAEAVSLLQGYTGITIEAKPYAHISSNDVDIMKTQFNEIHNPTKPRPYLIDGLILVDGSQTYLQHGKLPATYKWKPIGKTTIDFLARKCPEQHIAWYSAEVPKPTKHPNDKYELYLLFVGITVEMKDKLALQFCTGYQDMFPTTRHREGTVFPIQFSPSDVPWAYIYWHNTTKAKPDELNLDNNIVELYCRGDCVIAGGNNTNEHGVDWVLDRVRRERQSDVMRGRDAGNFFHVAELTWFNYVSPLPFESLYTGPSGYFATERRSIYAAQTKTTNLIKRWRITTVASHKDWVIDLAVGRGADIDKYVASGVRHLIGIDIDRAALFELTTRKYERIRSSGRGGRGGRSNRNSRPQQNNMSLHLIAADLNQPWTDTVKAINKHRIPEAGVSVAFCNLAAHYMAGTVAAIENFATLCQNVIATGGTLVLTVMFGDRVFKRIHDNGGEWTIHEGGAVKYSIKSEYSSATLEAAGQMISIVLPFSNGEYYQEPLVNVSEFERIFREKGFSLDKQIGFDEHMSRIQSNEREVYNKLTDDDKEYLSLYGELIFVKNVSD